MKYQIEVTLDDGAGADGVAGCEVEVHGPGGGGGGASFAPPDPTEMLCARVREATAVARAEKAAEHARADRRALNRALTEATARAEQAEAELARVWETCGGLISTWRRRARPGVGDTRETRGYQEALGDVARALHAALEGERKDGNQ